MDTSLHFFGFLIDLWAIVGIGLEIWGFYWLLKYLRSPRLVEIKKRREEVKKMIERISPDKVPEKYLSHRDVAESEVDYFNEFGIQYSKDTPLWMIPEWEKRKIWSIRLVIIGLLGQIAQITHENIFEILQSLST